MPELTSQLHHHEISPVHQVCVFDQNKYPKFYFKISILNLVWKWFHDMIFFDFFCTFVYFKF